MPADGLARLNERQRATFIRMYNDPSNYTLAIIGQRFGIDSGNVHKWAKRLDLVMRAGGNVAGSPVSSVSVHDQARYR